MSEGVARLNPPLAPDLTTHATDLRDRLVAEFDTWAVAQNRAAERLGSEVEAARAATKAAEQAQAEADEALAAADIARDAAEGDRDPSCRGGRRSACRR
jgi:hypothetical protein